MPVGQIFRKVSKCKGGISIDLSKKNIIGQLGVFIVANSPTRVPEKPSDLAIAHSPIPVTTIRATRMLGTTLVNLGNVIEMINVNKASIIITIADDGVTHDPPVKAVNAFIW